MKKVFWALLLTGCCTHGEVAREAERINAHLAVAAVSTEAKAVAEANLKLWKEIR